MNALTNDKARLVARLLCVGGFGPPGCYLPVADREQVVRIVEELEKEARRVTGNEQGDPDRQPDPRS